MQVEPKPRCKWSPGLRVELKPRCRWSPSESVGGVQAYVRLKRASACRSLPRGGCTKRVANSAFKSYKMITRSRSGNTYTQASGIVYCTPWTEKGGNAAGDTPAACQKLCDQDASCVAITWFPSWKKKCYLASKCDKTGRSSVGGRVWRKQKGYDSLPPLCNACPPLPCPRCDAMRCAVCAASTCGAVRCGAVRCGVVRHLLRVIVRLLVPRA